MKKLRMRISALLLTLTLSTTVFLFSFSTPPAASLAAHTSPDGWCCIVVDGKVITNGLCL